MTQIESNDIGNQDRGDFSGIPAESQFFTIGWLSQRFQATPEEIRSAMRTAGVRFVRSENDVPRIDGFGLIELGKVLRAIR